MNNRRCLDCRTPLSVSQEGYCNPCRSARLAGTPVQSPEPETADPLVLSSVAVAVVLLAVLAVLMTLRG